MTNTLRFAADQGRVLYSFNVGDFHQLHTQSCATGLDHCGIILAPQKRYSTGEQLRRLVRLIGSWSAGTMRNREEFLGRW